jgi:DegV family protein with EDD domain
MGVRIVTDSGCDLTHEEMAKFGVDVVPVSILFGEERLRDGVDITRERFYARVKAGEVPRTEPAGVEDYARVFERGVSAGDEVVMISLSGKISKSYENAASAAAKFGGRVQVVDSLGAAGIESLLAMYAIERVRAGDDAAEIVRKLDPRALPRVIYFAVPELTNLSRSGRLPKPLIALGSMLNVSLVLKMSDDGTIGPAGQSRSFDKTCDIMVDAVLRTLERSPKMRVAISHVQASQVAARLSHEISSKLGHPPSYEHTAEAPLTLATNMGDGAVGISGIVV